ncbi:hypothetical protein [Sphaerimonospora thailandensis]|uniref:Uncharacterized protein n=1 Tax=Sphaerimonospora thailandensis TaxID=795644 RepID=A0A8J3W0I2_9ACTN|nr:hypothetical protein [Sphaerimonospora thailandensis]GIH71642.1 hypothetical protein Mth01_38950 [Sphaerimonospora thailandensis]
MLVNAESLPDDAAPNDAAPTDDPVHASDNASDNGFDNAPGTGACGGDGLATGDHAAEADTGGTPDDAAVSGDHPTVGTREGDGTPSVPILGDPTLGDFAGRPVKVTAPAWMIQPPVTPAILAAPLGTALRAESGTLALQRDARSRTGTVRTATLPIP